MYRLKRPKDSLSEQEVTEQIETEEPKAQFHSPLEQLIELQQKFEKFRSAVETDSPHVRFSPSKIKLSELSDRFIELEANIAHESHTNIQTMSERLVFGTLLASSWTITIVTVLHVFGLI
jgi:hypothetical protein